MQYYVTYQDSHSVTHSQSGAVIMWDSKHCQYKAQIAEQKAPFKNLVHNGVDFYVQNALNSPTSISNSKTFSGGDTPDPR